MRLGVPETSPARCWLRCRRRRSRSRCRRRIACWLLPCKSARQDSDPAPTGTARVNPSSRRARRETSPLASERPGGWGGGVPRSCGQAGCAQGEAAKAPYPPTCRLQKLGEILKKMKVKQVHLVQLEKSDKQVHLRKSSFGGQACCRKRRKTQPEGTRRYSQLEVGNNVLVGNYKFYI